MITASTKRNPAMVNNKVGPAVTHLASVELTFAPIPVSPEVVEKYKLKSPKRTYETGVMSVADVLEGDTLTYAGVTYQVVAAPKWTDPVAYTKILMEQPL